MTNEPTAQIEGIEAQLAERGLSIREAARQAGVHEASFRRLIKGHGVHPATAKRIADFLGMRVSELRSSINRDRSAA